MGRKVEWWMGVVTQCAQRASCGGFEAVACLYWIALLASLSSLSSSSFTVQHLSAESSVICYMKRGGATRFRVGRAGAERIVTVVLCCFGFERSGLGGITLAFMEPGVPLPHMVETLSGVMS